MALPISALPRTALNETHDPARKSWIESANAPDCEFPIQNLPYGVFDAGQGARIGLAIGDKILDLGLMDEEGLIPSACGTLRGASLNAFMALGPDAWRESRARLCHLLTETTPDLRDHKSLRQRAFVAAPAAAMKRPFAVAGFTDFYASREHATNVGTMFRGAEKALMPNWLHIPIAYNGRASTVVVSGTAIHRPWGQSRAPGAERPASRRRKARHRVGDGCRRRVAECFGPTVTVDEADAMIFGFVLLNDWSARDLQVWEYQPLGPFQAKAFASTISPWVVTSEALRPFRVAGPAQAPEPLPYLRQDGAYNFDVDLAVGLATEASEATTICETNARFLYWSSAQQLAHHTACGCAMQTGDLLGSGTISGPTRESLGSLLELTWNGERPLTLNDGSTRSFLADGDSVTIRGRCRAGGLCIGFGEACGKILPAVPFPLSAARA